MANELVPTEPKKKKRRRNNGRMGRVERRLRQQQFALLLLDMDQGLTRAQICEQCGISERTYDRWSTDPEVLKLSGMDSTRMDAATRKYAYEHRGTAMRTIVDVMDRSRNDIARVRAAELMYQWGEEAAKGEGSTGSSNSDELTKLLSGSRPTFIFGNATMIQNLTPAQNPSGLTIIGGVDDDVIDAEARVLPPIAP
jgi:hypothetical protein